MQSKKDRWQEDLVVASPLRDLVPQGHLLRRVDENESTLARLYRRSEEREGSDFSSWNFASARMRVDSGRAW